MTDVRVLPAWPYPCAIAHRGAGKLALESTLAAFCHDTSFGYHMFKFDVKLSGDGMPAPLHDTTLDHTTNGAGRLDASTLGQITQLDAGSWHSPAYADEPVPTLVVIARYLRANNFLANIEIKSMPGTGWCTGAAVTLDARTLRTGVAVPPLLSSSSEDALAATREAMPELPHVLLLDKLPVDWLDRLRTLGCIALDANHRELMPEIIDQVHAADFRVCRYTVSDLDRAHLLWSAGLDGLIIDWVDRISPV